MAKIDYIARIITSLLAIGFLMAAIFNVLDYFIVKFLLFGIFGCVVVAMFLSLFTNENHPEE